MFSVFYAFVIRFSSSYMQLPFYPGIDSILTKLHLSTQPELPDYLSLVAAALQTSICMIFFPHRYAAA